MIRPRQNELRLPATEYRQGGRTLYSFVVDGKRLPEFATISRVHRDGNRHMQGYQRPEVLSHIAEIRTYLESAHPLIPNSIVVAFDKPVRFEPLQEQPVESADSRLGVIGSLWIRIFRPRRNRHGSSMASNGPPRSGKPAWNGFRSR